MKWNARSRRVVLALLVTTVALHLAAEECPSHGSNARPRPAGVERPERPGTPPRWRAMIRRLAGSLGDGLIVPHP